MSVPIYFSKVEFQEIVGYENPHSSILLDVVQGELSYQVYEWKRQMPGITGTESYEYNGKLQQYKISHHAKTIQSGKNGFLRVLIPDENYEQKVVFSYGIQLTKIQMKQLLPYCNALEFEPYRYKKMSMNDEGYIGYRDEVNIRFIGVTDSYIPKMEWIMRYYYDERHIWPSEKLYRYLVLEYFKNNKKLKGWELSYGSSSLFLK